MGSGRVLGEVWLGAAWFGWGSTWVLIRFRFGFWFGVYIAFRFRSGWVLICGLNGFLLG